MRPVRMVVKQRMGDEMVTLQTIMNPNPEPRIDEVLVLRNRKQDEKEEVIKYFYTVEHITKEYSFEDDGETLITVGVKS